MSQNPTIKLPAERIGQLKAIGAVLNLSIADTVGYLIRREIDAGTIKPGIPGITVRRIGDAVSIAFSDHPPRKFLASDAVKLADAIVGLTTEDGSGVFSMDSDFVAVRKGNGIEVQLSAKGTPRKVFSRDVARDFAGLIRNTVAEAQ